jgi:hypothetical protein
VKILTIVLYGCEELTLFGNKVYKKTLVVKKGEVSEQLRILHRKEL